MKRINKITILTMVIITLTLLIGATQQTDSTSNDIKSIETTSTGMLVTYNDNTGYYVDFNEVKEVQGCKYSDAEFNDFVVSIDNKEYYYNSRTNELVKIDSNNNNNFGSAGYHKYRINKMNR